MPCNCKCTTNAIVSWAVASAIIASAITSRVGDCADCLLLATASLHPQAKFNTRKNGEVFQYLFLI